MRQAQGEGASRGGEMPRKLEIRIPQIMSKDNLEVFLYRFEWSAWAAGWLEDQWLAILIPQPTVDTLAPAEVTDYSKV